MQKVCIRKQKLRIEQHCQFVTIYVLLLGFYNYFLNKLFKCLNVKFMLFWIYIAYCIFKNPTIGQTS